MNANEAARLMLAEKGVSQQKLAEMLGFVGQTNVSMALKSEVRCQFVARVAEALGYELILRDKETGKEVNIEYDPGFVSGRSKK